LIHQIRPRPGPAAQNYLADSIAEAYPCLDLNGNCHSFTQRVSSVLFIYRWNIGPQDDKGNSGLVEAALTGLEIEDVNDPVEVGIVACSFDSCLVCTVHAHDVKSGMELAKFKI
jgi:Nickel-dependent hydrogenase